MSSLIPRTRKKKGKGNNVIYGGSGKILSQDTV
jgi:hypothetical protein